MTSADERNEMVFSLRAAEDEGQVVAGFYPLEEGVDNEHPVLVPEGLALPEVSTKESELWGDSVMNPDKAVVAKLITQVEARLASEGTEIRPADSAKAVVELLDELVQEGDERTFFLYDLGTVIRKYEQWCRLLPRVRPFYAIKCNPDPVILSTLYACGAGFDCASEGEIEAVLGIGATPADIIYANPCKQVRSIKRADELGVRRMTFDNKAELEKIASNYPGAEVVVRIKPPVEMAKLSFSVKFGASTTVAINLVKRAKALGVKCVGVSFHVGSGCYDIEAYLQTLKEARKVFDTAESIGCPMTLLDIGGGWPGVDGEVVIDGHSISFPNIAKGLSPLLDELFGPEVVMISEPGRYFVTECAILCANVIAKRVPGTQVNSDDEDEEDQSEHPAVTYYISDGVYGSFNAIHYDHMTPDPRVLKNPKEPKSPASPETEKILNSTLFGPTCDSMDIVCTAVELPDLSVGDWLYFYNMGAYTRSAACAFNGFPLPACHYYISQ